MVRGWVVVNFFIPFSRWVFRGVKGEQEIWVCGRAVILWLEWCLDVGGSTFDSGEVGDSFVFDGDVEIHPHDYPGGRLEMFF